MAQIASQAEGLIFCDIAEERGFSTTAMREELTAPSLGGDRLRNVDGYGYGNGYGDSYSYGDGNGDGYGNGDSYSDSAGDGYGDGYGYGNGDGDGYGYGYGNGDGYGDGNGKWMASPPLINTKGH